MVKLPPNVGLYPLGHKRRTGNPVIHFHCCVIDGVFSTEDETLRFDEAAITPEAIAQVQAKVRERVLRLFKRRTLLSAEDVGAMRQWGHEGGFSPNAEVIVAARDRAGLERLFRYCARPIFAGERLQGRSRKISGWFTVSRNPGPMGKLFFILPPWSFWISSLC